MSSQPGDQTNGGYQPPYLNQPGSSVPPYQQPVAYPNPAGQYPPASLQAPVAVNPYQPYQAPSMYATPYPAIAYVAQPPVNGMGIAGMVLGIVSLAGGGVTIVMPIVGLILSIIGRNTATEEGSSPGQAIAGIVCNAIALVIYLVVIILYIALLHWLMTNY